MGTKRIDLSLFDDNLKGLINASAKIFPMSLSDIQANLNPNLYEYARIIDVGPRRNEIYIWANSVFELIGADDKTMLWTDVQSKPTTFAPSAHAHFKAEITDLVLSTVAVSGSYVDLIGKPTIPTDTNQLLKTDVYTKTEVTTSLALKSDAVHDHDGRYNTKAEITSALGGKSDTTHDHNLVYAVKSTEGVASTNSGLITGLRTDVNTNTNSISTIQTNMANGDMHSNIGILNQLTQILLDSWNGAVAHISDTVKHITGAERIAWNAKSNFSGVYADLTSKPVIPTVVSALTNDSAYQTDLQVTTSISGKADKSYVDTQDATKVDSTTFTGHTSNTTVHVFQTDKDNWNSKEVNVNADWNSASGDSMILNKPTIPVVTGTNTGDETLATIKTKLAITTLSGTNTGDQDLSGYVKIVQGTTEPVSTAYWFKEMKGKVYFDGVGDYLTIAASTGFAFSTGDFCVEAIIKANVTSGFIFSSGTSGEFFFGFTGSSLGVGRSGVAWDSTSPATIVAGSDYHIAISRVGTSLRFFANGVQMGSTLTNSVNYLFANIAYIGSQGAAYYYSGNISGLRVTKGLARYTSNFTPPTDFINDANTVLCMRFAEEIGARTFVDDTGKTVTTYGDVVIVA